MRGRWIRVYDLQLLRQGSMKRAKRSSFGGKEDRVMIDAEAFEGTRSEQKNKSAKIENNVRGRSATQQEVDNEDQEAEQYEYLLKPGGDYDLCSALMDRYARSSAPQHRHLCATAAAMRAILCEEGLPLTPPAYFAAAITAVRDTDGADREGVAALSAFLAVVLPLVPMESLTRAKAKDAAFVLASFLRDASGDLSTGSLRSLVKSLGLVALRVDLDDWSAVELPLDTLVQFAVDKRPKVRRCAQACLETVFKAYNKSSVIKKASKVVLCIHKKSLASVPNSSELTDANQNSSVSKPEHVEALHILNFLNVILPYLSDKVRMKIFSDVYMLLGCHYSWSTRHILRLLEVLLEHLNVKVLADEVENIMSALTSYVCAEKNPIDTIISATTLLKYAFRKFRDAFPSMWMRYLPLVFTSLTGYLRSDSDTSKHVAGILKELIDFHIDQSLFRTAKGQSGNYDVDSIPEAAAISSICNVADKMIRKSSFPTEHMLEVISILFLKLGESSFFFMKKILIRLSRHALNVEEERLNMEHLEQCIGAAIISMGPEKLLSVVPIAIDMEKMACSNSWIIPILRKYVIGASLEYYVDNFVPLAKTIQKACKKVKNESVVKSLQSSFHSIWDLLPAFCRYPTDLSEKFESLSLLFIAVLKEEPSLHEIIALALQVLVHSNIVDNKHRVDDPSIIFSKTFNMEMRNLSYSEKVASKNMKALASRSIELFQILKDIFFDCSERRGYIKDALGSLGYVIPGEYIRNFFLSSLKTIDRSSDLAVPESLDNHGQEKDKNVDAVKTDVMKNEEWRCLMMELACSFVEAADTDLTNIVLDLIRSSLLATNDELQRKAYCTLSQILKVKDRYATTQFDELMELLFTVKPPIDTISLQTRFSCFDNLLVFMLKSNGDMNTQAFLILNEIILTLKSKKESRKLAYDTLLTISSRLKSPHSLGPDSDLLRLFNMVMGYLSSSSPHIISGAVSALSLLIFHDASFCLSVPNLIPSVLVLLKSKANEVIKATLGFIKVLVSSLNCNELMKLLPEIIHGILPWSSVSKHHFRSKVGIILEILLRKCSSDAVEKHSPEKYKGFVKSIKEGRQNRKILKGDDSSADSRKGSSDSTSKGGKKRPRDEINSSRKTGKKSKKGFPNKGFSKAVHKGLRNQSTAASRPNSHSLKKVRPRSIANNHKRRNAEHQKPSSGVDTRVRKQKRPLGHVTVKKIKAER